MKKFSILILLFFISKLYSQEQHQTGTYFCSLVGGINSSTFHDSESSWDNNYNFGIYFKNYISNNFALLPMLTYSKHASTVNQLEGKFYSDNNVYKTFYDIAFEASFIELNLLYNYSVHQLENVNYNFGIGLGYSLGLNDYSKFQNVKLTDQIIGDFDNSVRPVEISGNSNRFSMDNNGFLLTSNFTLNYERINLTIMYSLKMFKLKEIGNLHTVTFLVGFFIF